MCTTGCPAPGSHSTWGECLRAKGLQIQPGIMDKPERNQFDRDLQSYSDARHEGLQPQAPDEKSVVKARQFADATGVGNPWQ